MWLLMFPGGCRRKPSLWRGISFVVLTCGSWIPWCCTGDGSSAHQQWYQPFLAMACQVGEWGPALRGCKKGPVHAGQKQNLWSLEVFSVRDIAASSLGSRGFGQCQIQTCSSLKLRLRCQETSISMVAVGQWRKSRMCFCNVFIISIESFFLLCKWWVTNSVAGVQQWETAHVSLVLLTISTFI